MISMLKPFIELFFPTVCACCGLSLEKENSHICIWCTEKRFERSDHHALQILPESVHFQYSMWQFDKGGYLQQLLHSLKYNNLQTVGVDLGIILGRTFLNDSNPDIRELLLKRVDPLIVPIPLHKSKLRKRGYNQAEALAQGFSSVTSWEVAKSDAVLRVKKTTTQTGLSTGERVLNVKDAFQVSNGGEFRDRLPILIDDVFTTGATTFELARVLKKYSRPAGIVTVARA